MHKLLKIFILFFVCQLHAQQLNCTVNVNSQKVGVTNTQIFKTLEKSLTDFINKTDWTGQVTKPNERINCSMFITVNEYTNEQFSATIQVQSSRTAFNSSYTSPILNFNDNNFNFKYTEFENLTYSPNSFVSNLISTISFYSYMIIAMDSDTLASKGGTKYLETALDIVNLAQQSGYKGWTQSDGNQSRYFFINDMLSNTFLPFREALFTYHYEGLDNMHKDPKLGKEKVKAAILNLGTLYEIRPNAFLTRVFFDAKSDEIVSVFSDGPIMQNKDLIDVLNKISPLNAAKWTKVK